MEIKELYEKNPYFAKPAKERYEDFKNTDPFPEIPQALLNYEDILKYVLTTGMIDPFEPEPKPEQEPEQSKLSGAIYTCDFSGKYFYWDNEGKYHTGSAAGEGLTLLSNSITFLEIKQYFRIPSYIALRFNLRVHHVYKGLLLGTGPIIDPGFIGRIHIPLHNLTSNEYVIKKDAPLINVEFTKLSHNPIWDIEPCSKHKKIVQDLNFSGIQYRKKK